MVKEYAIYPFRYMNITQRHDQGNHKPHWYKVTNHSDKPWDEACKDTGRSYFEPQNDFLIQEVKGLNTTKSTNSVRLKSVNKLYIPYKSEPDYLYLTLTHMNEDNLKQVKVGQVLKKGTKILMEGTDGNATGNHFHITANIGKYYGLLQNNNGKWCWTYEKSLLPNEAFYLDKDYTNIKNANKYSFNEVPKEIVKVGTPVERDTSKDQVQVIVPELNVRNKPNTNGTKLGFANIGFYDIINSSEANGYTWYEIEKEKWIAGKETTWTLYFPKEKIIEEKKEEVVEQTETPQISTKEENDTNTLPPTEITQNEQKNNELEQVEEKENFLITFLKRLVDFLTNIINKKN